MKNFGRNLNCLFCACVRGIFFLILAFLLHLQPRPLLQLLFLGILVQFNCMNDWLNSINISISLRLCIINQLILADKPGPPKGPASVEWTQDALELRWRAPDSDGGAAITEYIVERREVGKKSWKQVGSVSASTQSIEIRGLKKNAAYNFRVIAKNSVGCGEPFIIVLMVLAMISTP